MSSSNQKNLTPTNISALSKQETPTSPYQDIINLSRPKSKRPKMPIKDRAKIFSPFAALKKH